MVDRAHAAPERGEIMLLAGAGAVGKGRKRGEVGVERAGNDHLARVRLRRAQRERIRIAALRGVFAIIARRDDNHDPGVRGAADGVEQDLPRRIAAEREIDDLGPRQPRGVDPRGNGIVRKGAALVLARIGAASRGVGAERQDRRVEGDAEVLRIVARASGRRGHRGAVAVFVGHAAAPRDVAARGIDPPGEFGERRIDPRVDHRQLDPLARRARLPRADRLRRNCPVRAIIFGRIEARRRGRGRGRRGRHWSRGRGGNRRRSWSWRGSRGRGGGRGRS